MAKQNTTLLTSLKIKLINYFNPFMYQKLEYNSEYRIATKLKKYTSVYTIKENLVEILLFTEEKSDYPNMLKRNKKIRSYTSLQKNGFIYYLFMFKYWVSSTIIGGAPDDLSTIILPGFLISSIL